MKPNAPPYATYDVVTLEQLRNTLDRISKEVGPKATWYVWKDGGIYVCGDTVPELRAVFPFSKGGRRIIPSPRAR